MPSSYQSDDVKAQAERMRDLNWPKYRTLSWLKDAKKGAIEDLIDEHQTELMAQTIPEDALDVPDFIWQQTNKSCVGTSFLMVMNAITGTTTISKAFRQAIEIVYGSETIHDEEYLKLLQSEAFAREFDKTVSTVSFMGADLNTITKLAEGIRARLPGQQVFCVVSLLTDTFDGKNFVAKDLARIWHSNVLLSADQDYVVVHDPAPTNGAPDRRIPKDVFMHRWAQSNLRGHLIVA